MNSNDFHGVATASAATRRCMHSLCMPLALFSFALSLGLSIAAETPIEACKKKSATDYRLALRQCDLSDRALRPPVRNCRPTAKARYDTALSRCFTVVERKAGEGQRDFLCGSGCPPPPPPPPPDPKPK